MEENKMEEDVQTFIAKCRCPTPGCNNYTFLEIPTDLKYEKMECKVCGKITPTKEWLS
jgi:hypothetical protein